MANVVDVADAVQRAYGPQPLSWPKLHKLLYFCQGWSIAWTGTPLFHDRIEAWRNGPVAKGMYRIQRHYPSAASGSAGALKEGERRIVDEVVRFYGRYSAQQLIELTHREPPWRNARRGIAPGEIGRNPIPVQALRDHFAPMAKQDESRIPPWLAATIDVLLSVPEDQVDQLGDDSGVSFDDEMAYLRGQGPDPWASAQRSDEGSV